jgi:hypothetical protein
MVLVITPGFVNWLRYTSSLRMIDLRPEVPKMMLRWAEACRDAEFVWKRFRAREQWSHDHCLLCSACICEQRTRDPYDKPGPVDNGHYRHAFYSEKQDGTYTWVCRSCFKRVQPLVKWSIRRPTSRARLRPGRRRHGAC